MKAAIPPTNGRARTPRKPISNGIFSQDHGTDEDPGTRRIAGVDRRTPRNDGIDVGVMGNDQPLAAMHETWHSQELAINLLPVRTGPMTGEQNFTITGLSTTESDPDLFKVPDGYKIRDMREGPSDFLLARYSATFVSRRSRNTRNPMPFKGI